MKSSQACNSAEIIDSDYSRLKEELTKKDGEVKIVRANLQKVEKKLKNI